jgi:hypothetical protein
LVDCIRRVLSAPTTRESFSQLSVALRGIHYPSTVLPRRLVAQVLGMAAGQVCHPVAIGILMEIN